MTLVILSPCIDVKDGSCTAVCPVDCIYEGERMYYIHPTECIECGVCETICPVDAISWEDEVPSGEEQFLDVNTAAFHDAGGTITVPGGWSRHDKPLRDPRIVRRWPGATPAES